MSIDLGTANTLIFVPNQGVVLNEPSVVAVRQYSANSNRPKIVAVGLDAKSWIGRTSSKIEVIRPLRDGVVAELTIAEKMLQYFINKVNRRRLFSFGPHVLICVPCGATAVERRAIRAAAEAAGAYRVEVYEEPILAALGAGVNIEEACGSFILDIGGGTSEVAVLSLGDIVHFESSRIGGDHFNQSIIEYVRREFNLLIGEATAERVKHKIGNAYPPQTVEDMEIRGRRISDASPHGVTINTNEIHQALQEPLRNILDRIRCVLEMTPPELSADIMSRGIVVTGGGALLTGLDQLISQEIGVPVLIADDPLTCVARGGGVLLERPARRDSDSPSWL